jgi:Protein of unknown function (DUF3159)
MVRGAARTAEHDKGSLTEPTFRGVFLTGLPGFLREGFLPLGVFYLGLELGGLVAGIGSAAAVSVLIYLVERRAGRDGLLVRLSLAFVAVQSLVGLLSHSATVYLAQPVLANAAWGAAFLVSVAVRRPLAGALACAWYPFPLSFRETDAFKRVFGIESIVWGVYFLARSGIRLAVLLQGGLESFVVTVLLTGPPAMILLAAWSVRYAIRRLDDEARAPRERGVPSSAQRARVSALNRLRSRHSVRASAFSIEREDLP